MEIFLSFGYMAVGIFLLYWCGDKLVEGAIFVAKKLKVSPLFIGVAIIGFGTSMPEILASISAAKIGKTEIALGNIIGSNIANLGLVLGLALILMSKFTPNKAQVREFTIMTLAMWLFSALLMGLGQISAFTGGLLITAMFIYIAVSLKAGKGEHEQDTDEFEEGLPTSTKKSILYIAIGLVGLFIGADLTIKGAVEIATSFGVSDRVIGLTMVAIGTSLPEIAATLAAARHGNIALTIGNVAGSNAFNVLAAGGAAAMVAPIVPSAGIGMDLLAMLAFGIMSGYLFLVNKPNTKALGITLMLAYAAYIAQLALV